METLAQYVEKLKGTDHDLSIENRKIVKWSEHIETLKSFPEFKNVKKINILTLPTYLKNVATGAPAANSDHIWGQHISGAAVQTYPLTVDSLEEEVDLYDLTLTAPIYDPNVYHNLGFGIWVWPLIYNPTDFTPKRKIEIIFSHEQPQDHGVDVDDSHDEVKQEILSKLSAALDKMEVNVPQTRRIMIRCSSRSIKPNTNEEN